MPNVAGVRAYGDEPEEGGGDFGASGQVGGRPFVADWSFDFVPRTPCTYCRVFTPFFAVELALPPIVEVIGTTPKP